MAMLWPTNAFILQSPVRFMQFTLSAINYKPMKARFSMHLKHLLSIAATAFFLFSCKPKEKTTDELFPKRDTTQTYWSVNQYIDDQIDTYGGQPFSLSRIATINGKTDSALVNFFDMDWPTILEPFRNSDIGDKKFLGKYEFSMFDDNNTGNRTFYYEAKEKELFTRKLQLVIDPTNFRILSVYIETAKDGTLGDETSKLLYIPLKIIQIQQNKSSMTGSGDKIHIDYRFLQ